MEKSYNTPHFARGRLGGAMVLGKLPVPGRPSDLADSRAAPRSAIGRAHDS